ncbi:AraC family transcriptional regulator [Paenibacillus sp. LHD-117]|uniref:AraC family transcriptional regulator n=1 Tax=Paenibacillus sp. LHD-117 TaxID=3071412 RepID=UPI0027DFD07D|nr:AraC family transcriptional regulator [Paenibacillus sp. LHD-117]MDQ6421430.1 AraC family transcriptional regulator [Paenibacillus sp. LHD-117]
MSKKNSTSFLRKSFFSFLIITIVIAVLLTIFLTITYLRSSISIINRYNHELIEHNNYSIKHLDDAAKKLGNALYSDKDIIQFINMKSNDEIVAILASKVIDKHFLTLQNIDSVYLYNTELNLFYSSRSGERRTASTFTDQAIVALLTDKTFVNEYSGRPIVTSVDTTTQSANIASYILFEPGVAASGLKNAIVVNIKTKALTDSIQAINGDDPDTKTSFLVVDSNGFILSQTLTPEFESNMNEVRALSQQADELDNSSNQIREIGGVSYLVSSSKSNANNWYIIGLTPVKETFKDVIRGSFISAVIVVVIIIICAVASLYLARRLNHPIQMLTKIINGELTSKNDTVVSKMDEIKYILSVFESMKEKNQELDKIIHDAGYAVKEDFLNALLSESKIDTRDTVLGKLNDIDLHYISTNQLCMCLIKIDNYSKFASMNSKKERSALRYAIVNIATELAANYGRYEIFSSEPDKFVVLMDCSTVTEYKVLQEKVEQFLREVQSNTLHYLRISLSMAYSTMFQGLEHLPSMHNNMKDSILLKMNFGHGAIITPFMMDEINSDNFHIPAKKEEQLVEKVLEGNYESAASIYQTISPMLYQYSYNEIVNCIVHLIYSIYSSVLSKMPAVKESQDLTLQQFLRGIQNAEVTADIDSVMDKFLQKLCDKVGMIRNTSNSNDHLIQRVIGIVEQEFSNTELCLSFIAEKLRLSSNYIGQIFKTAYGQSIAQYIFDTRMKKLDEYMRNTQLPLMSIIEKVGLERNNYFYTRFKKHFGMSLSEYRLQLGQDMDHESDMKVL